MPKILNRCLAEFTGTVFLVLFGCGTAVTTGCKDNAGIIATALAFGLTIVAMAYSIGNVSGCHINTAVSLSMLLTSKINPHEFFFYVLSQIIGSFVGAALLGFFFGSFQNLGGNQTQKILIDKYGDGGSLGVAFVIELILTFVFISTILGVTSKEKNQLVVGVVIGLTCTLIHLLGIPLTGTSINPARSLGPAVLQAAIEGNNKPIEQIWIFIIAPLIGSLSASVLYPLLDNSSEHEE